MFAAHRTPAAACSLVAVTAIMVLVAGPAGALPTSTPSAAIDSTNVVSAPGVARTIQTSPNWSGYIDNAPSGQTYSAVSGSWTQPAVRCTNATNLQRVDFWVGLDGYNNGSVEQDGSEAHCTDGVISYSTWWYMYPDKHGTGGPIRAGAHVSASVVYQSGTYTLSLTVAGNAAASFTTTQTCGDTTCDNDSAEWIVEAQCCSTELASGFFPMPDYGTVLMRDASVTSQGTTGVITTFPWVGQDIINQAGTKDLAVVSTLLGGGTEFKDIWKASG